MVGSVKIPWTLHGWHGSLLVNGQLRSGSGYTWDVSVTASACPAGRRSAGRELGAGTGSRDNSAPLEQRRAAAAVDTLQTPVGQRTQRSALVSPAWGPPSLSADAQSWPVTSIYVSTHLHIYVSTYLHIYLSTYPQWQLATAGSMLTLVIQTVCKQTPQLYSDVRLMVASSSFT